MGDMLRDGLKWLADRQKEHCMSPVIYWRGDESCELLAIRGGASTRQDDGAGGIIELFQPDFLFKPDDLILNGSQTEPDRGDLIVDGTETFEVMAQGQGEPESRKSDPFGHLLRVHVKQVVASE